MEPGVAILARNLGKRYRIGTLRQAYGTFRDLFSQTVGRWTLRRAKDHQSEQIWALHNVDLEVHAGEVLGIIGRNGAGKSTLLKVLSRITPPTEGSVEILGRVGSLLEVGAGFHPELTGRENVFFNGSILGMSRREIKRKFDEIVTFSGVEKFIDTPVKRYSSGMYVRLAFAVAAHMDPDILLVDEVLAVGDAAFRSKCIGKMQQVTRQGRTVLLVSHNMAAIEGLCRRCILLEEGEIVADGATDAVLERYIANDRPSRAGAETDLSDHPRRRPGSEAVLRKMTLSSEGADGSVVRMGRPLTIAVEFERATEIPNMRFGLAIETSMGVRVVALSPTLHAPTLLQAAARKGTLRCDVPYLRLVPGMYYITVILGTGDKDIDVIDQATSFSVETADVFGTGYAPEPSHGVFFEQAQWGILPAGDETD